MIRLLVARCVVFCVFLSPAAIAETIVIYGASGTLGSKIVTEALNRDHEVIGVSRNAGSMTLDHENFSTTSGDVTDVDSMVGIIADADVVIISVNGNGEGNRPENAIVNRAAQTFIAAAERLGDDAPRVIQMGGGCAGCGMADVTLKSGVQARLQQLDPELEVVDTTDHAAGTNPYYAPSKK